MSKKYRKLERIMTEPEYRALSHISYSKLSGLEQSPYNLIAPPMESTEPMIYGSAVDVLAFDGEEEFKKQFATMSGKKPGYKAEPIFKDLLAEVERDLDILDTVSPNLRDYEDLLLKIGKAAEYGGSNWGDAAIIKNLLKEGEEYFQFLVEAKGKKVLSEEQYSNCRNSVETLYTHSFTKHLFTVEEGENKDIYFQFPIVWEYKDPELNEIVTMKCLLDILIIDHDTKTIQPKDLKTTGKHVLGFPDSFVQWNYALQASSYTDAVIWLISEHYPEYKDYTVELFEFVVIGSKDPRRPLTYTVDHNTLECGRFGGIVSKYDEYRRGYIELVRDKYWHEKNQLFDYPRYVYEQKGNLELSTYN